MSDPRTKDELLDKIDALQADLDRMRSEHQGCEWPLMFSEAGMLRDKVGDLLEERETLRRWIDALVARNPEGRSE